MSLSRVCESEATAPCGAHSAASILMSLRKEIGRKRAASARVPARTLRVNQLTQKDLAARKTCLAEIVIGEPIGAWRVNTGKNHGTGSSKVYSHVGYALASAFLEACEPNEASYPEKKLFLVKTIHRVGDEDVQILTLMDRDPANFGCIEVTPNVSAQIEERSDQFRYEVLEGADMLSAAEVATRTRFTRQHIHNLYRTEKLIGLIHPGRQRGLRYPAWQFEDGVFGAPLRAVLDVLKGQDPWDKWLFFVSKDDALAGFSPVELMTGSAKVVPHNKAALAMLQESTAARLQKVMDAAKEYVCD